MHVTRREILSCAVTMAAAAMVPRTSSIVRARGLQRTPAARTRIDTHHHVFPPPYVAALTAGKQDAQIATAWSAAGTLEDMERAGVATSILSVTQPAVTFAAPDVAARVARESNEWVARLIADNAGRFGSFATLPMPDVDRTLREIEYSLDTLKADGVCLQTSSRLAATTRSGCCRGCAADLRSRDRF